MLGLCCYMGFSLAVVCRLLIVVASLMAEHRSKCLLISILEPKKIKSITVFLFSPSICHEVMVGWMPCS